MVTSFNLNYGSWHINRELALLIDDVRVVREIKDYVRTLSKGGTNSRRTVRSSKGRVATPLTSGERIVRKRSDIPKGARLIGTHDGKRYTCKVDRPGSQPRVTYNGEKGLSLTVSAEEITGEPTNGPDFWWYGRTQLSELQYA